MAKRPDRGMDAADARERLAKQYADTDGTPGMLVRTVAGRVQAEQVSPETILDALALVESARAGVDEQELALLDAGRRAGLDDQTLGYAIGQELSDANRALKQRLSWLRQFTQADPQQRRRAPLRPA